MQEEEGSIRIKWKSKKKSKKNWFVVKECTLTEGLVSSNFAKHSVQKHVTGKSHLAFSVVYKDHSLDLVADHLHQYELWIHELRNAGIHEEDTGENYTEENYTGEDSTEENDNLEKNVFQQAEGEDGEYIVGPSDQDMSLSDEEKKNAGSFTI